MLSAGPLPPAGTPSMAGTGPAPEHRAPTAAPSRLLLARSCRGDQLFGDIAGPNGTVLDVDERDIAVLDVAALHRVVLDLGALHSVALDVAALHGVLLDVLGGDGVLLDLVAPDLARRQRRWRCRARAEQPRRVRQVRTLLGVWHGCVPPAQEFCRTSLCWNVGGDGRRCRRRRRERRFSGTSAANPDPRARADVNGGLRVATTRRVGAGVTRLAGLRLAGRAAA